MVPASSSSFCSSFSTTSPTYDLRQYYSSRLVLASQLCFHCLGRACGRLTILHNFVKTYCHANRPVIPVNIRSAKLRLPVSSTPIVDRYVILYCQSEHSLFSATPYTSTACCPLKCGQNASQILCSLIMFITISIMDARLCSPFAIESTLLALLFIEAINTFLTALCSILRIRTPHKQTLTKQTDKHNQHKPNKQKIQKDAFHQSSSLSFGYRSHGLCCQRPYGHGHAAALWYPRQ